jgi:CheY-like chemotaxis protein
MPAKQHSAQPDERRNAVRGGKAGDELRILLIEDSRLLRDRMIGMLTVPGALQVTGTAETEREAIDLIDAHDYDALVVDVELRQGSGIAAIRHARRAYEARTQPLIIVLTNYSLPTVEQRCISAGADHFLDKMQQFAEVRPLLERHQHSRGH